MMRCIAGDATQHAAEVISSAAMRQAFNHIAAGVSLHQYLCGLREGVGDATGHPEMFRE